MNGRSVFPVLILSSNGFSILTLRQAQGERIEKRTCVKLRGWQGERTGKKVSGNPKRLKMA
ncbi:MAG: hypothetical protein LBD67_02050 [Candidatus Accumulibacter sp.]|jgi:hypothetical protein|nr:hypothetical protein [Accumulibacter sp.]